MKVLLAGEFSGFYLNLKQGLQELGIDVTLAANGDGWKQIPGADLPLYRTGDKKKLKKIYYKLIEPVLDRKKLEGYDVVQMVHESIYRPYINSYMVRTLYVNVAGNCYSLYEAWRDGKLGYYTFDDNPDKHEMYTGGGLRREMTRRTERYVDRIADGIIPVMYEYAVGVRHLPNCRKTIPLPFHAEKTPYQTNRPGGKLVFYHGILREKDKGTAYIRQAFDIVQKKYPHDVEMMVCGSLPFQEYLEVLGKTNVLVDQCKEHCWGMNACYGMAQGKVVLGGASHNSLKEFGLEKSPVIHIKPDTEQIVRQIEYVIENRYKIEQWGFESRQFVETFHDYKKIAAQYLDVWKGADREGAESVR